MSTSPLLVFVGQRRGYLMVTPAPPQDMSILRQNEPWKECPHCRTALSLPKVHRQIIHIVESSSLAAQPSALAPAPPPPPPPSTPFPIHTLVLQISQHLPKNISNSPLPSPFWQHAPSSTPADPTASPRTLTPEPKETRCLLPHTRVASPARTDSSRLRCLADPYASARGQRLRRIVCKRHGGGGRRRWLIGRDSPSGGRWGATAHEDEYENEDEDEMDYLLLVDSENQRVFRFSKRIPPLIGVREMMC